MDWTNSGRLGYWREVIGGAALVCLLVVGARAEDSATKSAENVGNVEFDCPDAPKATVQIDLSQGLFADMFGIGDAAISGALEALAEVAGAKTGGDEVKETAEQMEAARQIVQLSGQLIKGVRVRVYQPAEKSETAEKLTAYYEKKLKEQHWETIARVEEDDEMVVVSAIRSGGAFKGLFVIASDGDELVLTNLVCDVSPENVKKIVSAATKSGLKAGLGELMNSGGWKVEMHASKGEPAAEVPAPGAF